MSNLFISAANNDFEDLLQPLQQFLESNNGNELHVRDQNHLDGSMINTVLKMNEYFAKVDAVIHLLGDDSGWIIDSQPIIDELFRVNPILKDHCSKPPFIQNELLTISMTQWEAYIAISLGRGLFVLQATDGYTCKTDRKTPTDDHIDSQKRHIARLKALENLYAYSPTYIQGKFNSLDALKAAVLGNDYIRKQNVSPQQGPNSYELLKLPVAPALAPSQDKLLDQRITAISRDVTWERAAKGNYCKREAAFKKLTDEFEQWCDNANHATKARDDGQWPLFWIGGGTGDGKSVLLMQLGFELINKGKIVYQLHDRTQLPAILEHLVKMRTPAFLLVDDLQKLEKTDKIRQNLDRLAESVNTDIRIIACGPTPEQIVFADEFKAFFQHKLHTCASVTAEDRRAIAAWLGKELTNDISSDLLVEFLFELSIEQPLEKFADSLKGRLEKADPTLLTAFKSILAINALDLVAESKLAPAPSNRVGGGFFDKLWKEKFDRLSKGCSPTEGTKQPEDKLPISDHRPDVGGYRFHHPQIAARVLLNWIGGSHASREDLIADCIIPSLLIKAKLASDPERSPEERLALSGEIRAIATQIKSRIPKLVADKPGKMPLSPAKMLDAIILSEEPIGIARVAMLHSRFALRLSPDNKTPEPVPNHIFESAIKIINAEESPHDARCLAAASLLQAAIKQKFKDVDKYQAEARQLLFEPKLTQFAPLPLVNLVATKNPAGGNYRPWALEWFEANNQSSHAGIIIQKLLEPVKDNPELLTAELRASIETWLDKNITELSGDNVAAALIKHSTLALLPADKTLAWLDKVKDQPRSRTIASAIWAYGRHDPQIRPAIKQWLADNRDKPWSHKALPDLLALNDKKSRDALIEALTPDAKAFYGLFPDLWERDKAYEAIRSLIPFLLDDAGFVERLEQYVGIHKDATFLGVIFNAVLKTKASEKWSKLALDWAKKSSSIESSSGSVETLKTIVSNCSGLPDVFAQAIRLMLKRIGNGENMSDVLIPSLKPLKEGGEDLQPLFEKAIAAAITHVGRANSHNPHGVLVKLLPLIDDEMPPARRSEILESACTWALANLGHDKLSHVVNLGLLRFSAEPQVAAVLEECLRARKPTDTEAPDQEYCTLLAHRVGMTDRPEGWKDQLFAWLSDDRVNPVFRRILLQGAVAIAPDDEFVIRSVLALPFREMKYSDLTPFYSAWIKASGADGPAIGNLLGLLGGLAGSETKKVKDALKFGIANALWRNKEICLARANAYPKECETLCYLLSYGPNTNDDDPERIYRLRDHWPSTNHDSLWLATIKSNISPDIYIVDLAAFTRNNWKLFSTRPGTRPHILINAIAENHAADHPTWKLLPESVTAQIKAAAPAR